MRRREVVVAALAALALVASCGGSGRAPGRLATSPSPPPSARVSPPTISLSSPAAALSPVETVPTKVLVVVLENHSQTQVLEQMSYLRGLATRYGRTTAYHALTHPSLPNYLAIAGGSTFGVRDDKDPASHPLRGASVFGQALAHQRTAKTYAEGMTRSCLRTSTGRYAVRHNPWTYFADTAERTGCTAYDVPMGTTASGALRTDTARGTLPNVGMVVPDVCSDAHDCSLATADRWLRAWAAVWLAGPDYRTGRLAVVVTFDEDDRSQGNTVLTVVVHPKLRGTVVRSALTHLDLSAWLSRAAGATPLRSAAGHASLGRAFGLVPL